MRLLLILTLAIIAALGYFGYVLGRFVSDMAKLSEELLSSRNTRKVNR